MEGQITEDETGLSNTLTRLAWNTIKPSLAIVINGDIARRVPIYDAEDRSNCSNYQPISILPVVRKLFEAVLHRKIWKLLITVNFSSEN